VQFLFGYKISEKNSLGVLNLRVFRGRSFNKSLLQIFVDEKLFWKI